MNSLWSAVHAQSDLLVDKVYTGGRNGNSSDDPFSHLTGVGNKRGFRCFGSKEQPKLVLLASNLRDPDWPDDVDRETGITECLMEPIENPFGPKVLPMSPE